MMEGIVETMLFFLGLRVLLSQQSKDKDMGKRGKRKNKYNNKSATEQELNNVVRKSERERLKAESSSTKKPFENIKLLPAREAQSGKI